MKLKRLQLVLSIAFLSILISCSEGDKKKADKKESSSQEYVYSQNDTKLEWTAYKTTDKLPVKGTFKNYKVINTSPSASVEELISSTSFDIESSSVFTGNDPRDYLLKEFFFGVFLNSENITGSFKDVKDGKGKVLIKLNEIEFENDITYFVKNDSLFIDLTMQLENWNGQKAVESINEKCLAMHKGPDGVSKTWSDVNVFISSKLK